MLHSYLAKHLPGVITILQTHKIRNAFVFGSAVTKEFNEQSDIDLLVNFEEGLSPLEKGELMWNLQFELEDLLQRKIDLLQESTPKNPYFIREINASKVKVYG
ncbi:MAG: nucleotidyltransferase domain-containing protein [Sphingobacteriales bacterium]|nr:MAG: nucleotidyltransferase domain-containing protein [Sphingobacteriales bacterium]